MSLQRAAAMLTITKDADNYVVGNVDTGDFVAVPPIGAEVLGWLRAGSGVRECAARASAQVGEVVDVEGFLQTLGDAGILSEPAIGRTDRALPGRRIGRVLVSRQYLIAITGLFIAAIICALADPRLLPRPGDFTITSAPLPNLLLLTSISLVCTIAHEFAHLCAASARGARARLSISRRLFFVTAQADLTRLWAVDRYQRYAPLLAGVVLDVASASAFAVLEAAGYEPAWIRATVAIQLTAAAFQGAVFMRTDLYAVIAAASGSVQFWRLKTAALRRCCRFATDEDGQLIAAASARELRWVRVYIVVFVVGNILAIWYLLRVALPGLYQVFDLSLRILLSAGVRDQRTWQAVLVLALIAVPATIAMVGFLRAATIVILRPLRRR